MQAYNTGVSKESDLIAFLFEGQRLRSEAARLAGDLQRWMGTSVRFMAFVDAYRDKIRKKIRVTREDESLLDLRSELEIAFCLLGDRRLLVAYEPYASTKQRGPDFAVTYRQNLVFNIEVARLRANEADGGETGGGPPLRLEERLLRILLNKLGQMRPGMGNLLVICTRPELARLVDLAALMQAVKTRAETRDSAFYAASRYASPAAFYKDMLRFSGILLWGGGVQVWANKQARPGLDGKAMRLAALLLESRLPEDEEAG